MKKELEYFMIDGEFGGNQDWFTNIVMNVGGCGAATACDSCIYLAKYKGMKKLYPFDLEQMDKEAYKKFSQIMKPYIRPRVQGVKKPEWYIEGLAKYISDVNEKYGTDYQIDMEKFDGTGTAEEAEKIIMEIPACRNRSLALTHLEDAMLRANLAVAEGVSLRGEG